MENIFEKDGQIYRKIDGKEQQLIWFIEENGKELNWFGYEKCHILTKEEQAHVQKHYIDQMADLNLEIEQYEPLSKDRLKAIAGEILGQLGGKMFLAMTGAKNLTFNNKYHEGNLRFNLPECLGVPERICNIYLVFDEYTLDFLNLKGDLLKTKSCVYCDEIRYVFEEMTGLNTSL